jgi:hypothetical protein
MGNTHDTAARWTEFVATHAAFPAGERLLQAFRAGTITRLCNCGCNSFDLEVPDGAAPLLVEPGGSGSVFQMEFEVDEPGSGERRSLEFIVFADRRGHFSGLEVDYCGNSSPVPDELVIHEPPYHVHCSKAIAA